LITISFTELKDKYGETQKSAATRGIIDDDFYTAKEVRLNLTIGLEIRVQNQTMVDVQ